jgi:hypothetical protein
MEGPNKSGITPYHTFQKGWVARAAEVAYSVRSMSGWTSLFLGLPTKEWLNDRE